jgi:uncharacterized protein YbaA (DUF1428 family)
MYVCGLVIPVPGDKLEAYRAWAQMSAGFFREYGCVEIVESWEDFVPEGKTTDFRKAVAAEEKMHHDPRMDAAGAPPFDARRLILGCFTPLLVEGR